MACVFVLWCKTCVDRGDLKLFPAQLQQFDVRILSSGDRCTLGRILNTSVSLFSLTKYQLKIKNESIHGLLHVPQRELL